MNYTYSLIYNSPSVSRSDGATIPADLGNTDWRQYQEWLAQGNTPTPVPLDIYKNNQRGKISSACSSTITGGFQSSALGAAHTYPSDSTTQGNVDRIAISGAGGSVWCGDSSNIWSFAQHTAAQVSQVQKDMVAFIQTQQTKYSTLVAQITAATTVEQVEAVNW